MAREVEVMVGAVPAYDEESGCESVYGLRRMLAVDLGPSWEWGRGYEEGAD